MQQRSLSAQPSDHTWSAHESKQNTLSRRHQFSHKQPAHIAYNLPIHTWQFSRVWYKQKIDWVARKWKQKEEYSEYLYSAIYTISKRSDSDHSFTLKLHHACLYFVSVHQMVPPLTEVADTKLQSKLISWPWWDERLSWPKRLIYGGWFTRVSGQLSATGQRGFHSLGKIKYPDFTLTFPYNF